MHTESCVGNKRIRHNSLITSIEEMAPVQSIQERSTTVGALEES